MTMKRAWLTVALAAVQPLYVAAQEPAKPDAPCRVEEKAEERASAALPARAGTHPMPERGTIAPATHVPSHVVSASSRAMAAARAREEQAQGAKKDTQAGCQPAAQQAAPVQGAKKD